MDDVGAELRRRFPDDDFLRWQGPAPGVADRSGQGVSSAERTFSSDRASSDPDTQRAGGPGWAVRGDAWAYWGEPDDDPAVGVRLVVGGGARSAAELLTDVAPGVVPSRISIPAGAEALLSASLRPVGGDHWDWFATSAAPPRQPAEERVELLGDDGRLAGTAVADEVAAFLGEHSPRSSGDPRRSGLLRWWGVRDSGGSVVATAAVERLPSGAAHLRSIAVARSARGGGLGAAVTSAVLRAALGTGAPAVCLGMYADNHTARRLYRRLGLIDSHHWSSGMLRAMHTGR